MTEGMVILLPPVSTASAMPLRLKEADEPGKTKLLYEYLLPRERRPWICVYDCLFVCFKSVCPRFEILTFLKALLCLKLLLCPEDELLPKDHIHTSMNTFNFLFLRCPEEDICLARSLTSLFYFSVC